MKDSATQAEWHDIEGIEVLGKGQGALISRDGSVHLDARHAPVVPKRYAYDGIKERRTITFLGLAILLGWLCATFLAIR